MRNLRSPIRYYGGKGMMVTKLIKLLPPHKIYVEPFGGGASLLFAKPPSPVEVYNDINSDLVNFFRVLRDENKFKKLYQLVCLTPYSREEFYCARDTLNQTQDETEKAYKFFILARMSFSGEFKNWAFSVVASNRNMAMSVNGYLSSIEMLPEVSRRLMRVQIENLDFRKIFKIYDTPDTLFYCDPPYIPEIRKNTKAYKFEMTVQDHEELVEILLKIKGKALLSGYKNGIYEKLEKEGWERIDYKTACHAAGKTKSSGILGKGSALIRVPRIESVWVSPGCFTLLKNENGEFF